jgi:Bacterial protein of unknown function (DUF937)
LNTTTKIHKALDEATLAGLSHQFGLDTGATREAVDELADELSWAVERNTLNRGGIAELVRLIGKSDHQEILAAAPEQQPVTPEVVSHGNQLLQAILGSKHESRGVANSVARRTDVGADTLKKLLPVVASYLMGGLQKASQSNLSDVAQRALPDAQFDTSRDFQMKPQRPLQVPGDYVDTGRPGGGTISSPRSPFDDLSDMIRRGGSKRPTSGSGRGGMSGRQAGGKVRDIVGDFLGFGSSGIVGWLIRLIVVRYGWRIVQFVFRRLLVGR